MRPIEGIVIHCADTPPGMDIGAADIRQWHKEKGWRDIGYHYIIRRSGEVETGRPIEEPGAHVKGHNARTIGICMVGGRHGHADYTRQQWAALEALVIDLTNRFPGVTVKGHTDYDGAKTCPNFNVQEWWT